MFINYAHRGASEYTPENTLLSFYTGVYMGANGIETDVQRTKDGILVLFHDDTLARVTGESGSVINHTFEELSRFLVRNGSLTDRIPTFEDFLRHFAFRDLAFAIELKQDGTEQDVADLIDRYQIAGKTTVTSFSLERIKAMRVCAPHLRTGYLTRDISDELLSELKALGVNEVCPHAAELTAEKAAKWHAAGFGVRAWGVKNEDLMRHAYVCGADGMTVNFPDKLQDLLQSSRSSNH